MVEKFAQTLQKTDPVRDKCVPSIVLVSGLNGLRVAKIVVMALNPALGLPGWNQRMVEKFVRAPQKTDLVRDRSVPSIVPVSGLNGLSAPKNVMEAHNFARGLL